MITLFRWIRVQQLKIKWQFELLHFADKQLMEFIKNEDSIENLEKKFVDAFARIIHESNQIMHK